VIKILLKYKIIDFCLNILFKNVKSNFNTSDMIIINNYDLTTDYIGYYVYFDASCHRIVDIYKLINGCIIVIDYYDMLTTAKVGNSICLRKYNA
jgi:hypothetical protein